MNQFFITAAGIVGGVGLVLLGMAIMSEGLQALAGDRVKHLLSRFTGNPLTGVLTGTGITVLIHSSSATILATIGFVNAGLLSLAQAIGIIFGSNLGTTSTAWIVALIGFKFHISTFTLPLITLGALMKLFLRGKRTSIGMALAGFGLLFLGADMLQDGMRGAGGFIDLAGYSFTSWGDRCILAGTGFLMTFLLQSSTVAIVTTLAALGTGTVSMEQAALIVVGLNTGKVYYGLLGFIGASTAGKRTALVHIFFNLTTGIILFLLVDFFVPPVISLCRYFGSSSASIIICTLHTAFNLLGIVFWLPVYKPVADLMGRLIPEKGPVLTRFLDYRVAKVPHVAVETARLTIVEAARVVMKAIRDLVVGEKSYSEAVAGLNSVDSALGETQKFLSFVVSSPDASQVHSQHLDVLHAMEHLTRLVEACRELENVRITARSEFLRKLTLNQLSEFDIVIKWLDGEIPEAPLKNVEHISSMFAEIRRKKRTDMISDIAEGGLKPEEGFDYLEAMRWIDRIAYHIWRSIFHLGQTSNK
ncbi:MAG TPA: Na/Pi symporter [Spirochaetota bacterium]|nr:Na/Pi symporter [Spirochaetota bacterium]